MWLASDVPGSLIPDIYLDYAKGFARERIVPVIDHNVQDIVTMAALFALFCRAFRDRFGVKLRVPRLNRSRSPKGYAAETITDTFRDRIRELCRPDQAVYDHLLRKLGSRQPPAPARKAA